MRRWTLRILLCLILGAMLVVGGCMRTERTMPWNLSHHEWTDLVNTLERDGCGGSRQAVKDLIWLVQVSDTERAELLQEAILNVRQARPVLFEEVVESQPSYVREDVQTFLVIN